jgi:glyoxylase-like metal-dependent hydrolase (beta-lactamase superfamily II)
MTIDGVKLEFYHWAPAHTSGDLIVYLVDQRVAATGDIIVTNRADDNPNVHFEKNGSTAGWIETVKGLIGLHAETYVTGHGTLLKQADLERKLAATTERRNRIAAMIKDGKTLDEIKAALPDAPAPGAVPPGPPPGTAQPGRAGAAAPGAARGGTPPLTFVDIAYRELGGK